MTTQVVAGTGLEETTEPEATGRAAAGPLPSWVRVLVVGAGFAGLAAGARLVQDGLTRPEDLLTIEQAAEVGGTWRDNTYPGCACDVPSSLYSFSFAPSTDWTRSYAPQQEIFAYLKRVATETGLRERVRFGCELLGADWREDEQCWLVQTSDGELRAQVLVAATGALSSPQLPDLPGLADYRGAVFHSARWDHDVDLRGKRVAVVGTGASAVQIVPAIADEVEHLTLLQRTPGWVLPRGDRPITRPERALYRRFPATQRLARGITWLYREVYVLPLAEKTWLLPAAEAVARWHLRRHVPDEALREQLLPSFRIGCKRFLLSNDYHLTLGRDDVTLVAAGAEAFTATGLVDGDGTEHPVDAVVFATGFTPSEPPVANLVRAADGRTLAESWDGSPRAHLGTTIAGFPNLFLMYGPNTNLGHSSIVYMLESQAQYLAQALRAMDEHDLASVDVRTDALASYNEDIQEQLQDTVWNAGGCASWYLDRTGRNSVMWPTFTWRFRRRTKTFDLESYVTQPASAARMPSPTAARRTAPAPASGR